LLLMKLKAYGLSQLKILSKYLTNWISSEFSKILEIAGSTLTGL
jgi:hypothetical protein